MTVSPSFSGYVERRVRLILWAPLNHVLPGARRARGRVLCPGRVEGRPPALLVISSELQVVALASPCRPRHARCRTRSLATFELPTKLRQKDGLGQAEGD